METTRKKASSHVRTEDLLPAPPIGRALAFAGGATVLGAAVWALVAFYSHREIGYLAWGIGAAIGFAIIKAGGHGNTLALAGSLLAVLSIGFGKQLAFKMTIDKELDGQLQQVDESDLDQHRKDAADWVALGAEASDAQIRQFAKEHDEELDSVAEFKHSQGQMLTWIHHEKPTLGQWRDHVKQELIADASFVDYLRDTFHPLDILFVVLGLATAFGMVSKHTIALQVAARQAMRRAADAEAEPETATADTEPPPAGS